MMNLIRFDINISTSDIIMMNLIGFDIHISTSGIIIDEFDKI